MAAIEGACKSLAAKGDHMQDVIAFLKDQRDIQEKAANELMDLWSQCAQKKLTSMTLDEIKELNEKLNTKSVEVSESFTDFKEKHLKEFVKKN